MFTSKTANDNGGPNVVSLVTRGAKTPSGTAKHIIALRKSVPMNDMLEQSARVELFDEYLQDTHRYIEVAGKREPVEALLILLDKTNAVDERSIYLLNAQGEIRHQFSVPDREFKAYLLAYNDTDNSYTRRNIVLNARDAFCNAATASGITLPAEYAASMFRCCAEQLMPATKVRAASR